jgi:hypothetical protein
MEMEPSEIATKCSSLDCANKVFSRNDRKSEPPSGPLPKPPSNSALSKSLDNEAQRAFSFTGVDFVSGQPSSWIPRSRIGHVGSPFGDDITNSVFGPHTPARLGRTNGTFVSNGTETVGFYGEEEVAKPREFAQDAPFNVRSSQQSESSTHLDEKKHTQDVPETPEAIASLELYGNRIIFH